MSIDPTPIDTSNDPAHALEELHRAVCMTHAAVAGLTAARERIPDYSETLALIVQRLDETHESIAAIEASPAIRLSPAAMATEIVTSGVTARQADQQLLQTARDAINKAVGQIGTLVDHGRAAQHQRRTTILASAASAAAAAVLMMVLPGVVARTLPANWQVPEWVAGRVLRLQPEETLVVLSASSPVPITLPPGRRPVSKKRGRRKIQ